MSSAAAPASRKGRPAFARLHDNLKKSIAANNFYESQQFYITLNHRYHLKGLHNEARALMVEGAEHFFHHKEWQLGLDLSLHYVESLEKNVKECEGLTVAILGRLHQRIPVELPDFLNFQNRAVRWSAACVGQPKTGSKALRGIFGANLAQHKMYAEARQQFVYSDEGKQFGAMLVKYSMVNDEPQERPLFLVQAVLQLLCIKSLQEARDVFATYTQEHPDIKASAPPYKHPSVNFIDFLFKAIDQKKAEWFQGLCKAYNRELSRDPSFRRYLAIIGDTYLGIKPQGGRQGGNKSFFGNLLENLFKDGEGGDSSESDSEDSTPDFKSSKSPAPAPEEDDLD